jgi:hypothetical protein
MRKSTAIVRPLLLAVVIALGFGTVWDVLLGWGTATVKNLLGPDEPHEYVQFRMDGTPLVRIYRRGDRNDDVDFRTLEGKPISLSRNEAWLQGTYLFAPQWFSAGVPWHRGGYWTDRVKGYNDGGRPLSYWYFVRDPEPSATGYFSGFDRASRQRIGYIGRNGFQAEMPAEEQRFALHNHKHVREIVVGNAYSQDGQEPWMGPYSRSPGHFPWETVYVVADDGIIAVDLLKRSTQVVLGEAGVISAGLVYHGMPSPVTTDSQAFLLHMKQYLAIRTADRIVILDTLGKQERSFVIPAEFRDVTFQFFLPSDTSAVLEISPRSTRSLRPNAPNPTRLVWIDPQGKITREDNCVLRDAWSPYSWFSFSPWQSVFSAPVPLATAIVSVALQPWISVANSEEPTFARALARSCYDFWLPLATVSALGAVLAWLSYRRQRRFGLPWAKTWALFVFLGGVPAGVAYYVGQPRPVMEKCPACDVLAPRDRPTCFACGRDFPAPAPKGIEVFA